MWSVSSERAFPFEGNWNESISLYSLRVSESSSERAFPFEGNWNVIVSRLGSCRGVIVRKGFPVWRELKHGVKNSNRYFFLKCPQVVSRLKGIETLIHDTKQTDTRYCPQVVSRLKGIETFACDKVRIHQRQVRKWFPVWRELKQALYEGIIGKR